MKDVGNLLDHRLCMKDVGAVTKAVESAEECVKIYDYIATNPLTIKSTQNNNRNLLVYVKRKARCKSDSINSRKCKIIQLLFKFNF